MVANYGTRVVYLLRAVSTALTRELIRELRIFDLTLAQLGALSQLGLDHPGALSGAELGHRSVVTPQSMSTAIADLLDRGLVERSPNPNHGRILDVRITPAGLELLAEVQVATARLEDLALRALPASQRRELRSTLRTMAADLDIYLPPAR